MNAKLLISLSAVHALTGLRATLGAGDGVRAFAGVDGADRPIGFGDACGFELGLEGLVAGSGIGPDKSYKRSWWSSPAFS